MKLTLMDLAKSVGGFFKRLAVRVCRFIVGIGRRAATSLGIKDKMKKSLLFQKLYNKVWVDKLRNR